MTRSKSGCIGALAILAVALYSLAQTELGKWIGGLVFVYGGTMFAGALVFSAQSATVVDVQPRDHPMFNGSIELAYVDGEGIERTIRKHALGSPGQLQGIEVGDRVRVLVCDENPLSVSTVKLQTQGGPPCANPDKNEKPSES